jgi:hypothetical protein
MDKVTAKQVSNIMALGFCICSLAVHFVAESLGTGNSPGNFALTSDGGQPQDPFEHTEDEFALSSQNSSSTMNLLISTIILAVIYSFLPAVLPQLPPPKFYTTA